jgi:NAD(P)-dependent dehydrogenase (short-subunit alcohol dehydrogenase family)
MDTVKSADFDYIQNVNVKASHFLIKQLAENLEMATYLSDRDACVINLSCLKGSVASPGMLSYCMSKAAVESMTKSYALDLADRGIRVNGVSASFMDTKLMFNQNDSEELRRKVTRQEAFINPMKRLA